MEEQMSQAMIVGESPSSLSQALTIPFGNKKFMVSNKLLVLIPFCLLVLSTDLVLIPILMGITSKVSLLHDEDLNSPESRKIIAGISKNFVLLIGFEILFLITISIYSISSLVVIIYARTGSTYTKLSIRRLFSRIDISWKKSIITWLYITLISFVLFALALILISVFPLKHIDMTLIILSLIVVILSTLCYFYLAIVWILSLVVTIMEKDYYFHRFERIDRGCEDLIKRRRLGGFVLLLILSIVNVVVLTIFASVKKEISRLIIAITVLCLVCLVKLFMFVVNSVIYNECKNSQVNEEQVEEEDRLGFDLNVPNEV